MGDEWSEILSAIAAVLAAAFSGTSVVLLAWRSVRHRPRLAVRAPGGGAISRAGDRACLQLDLVNDGNIPAHNVYGRFKLDASRMRVAADKPGNISVADEDQACIHVGSVMPGFGGKTGKHTECPPAKLNLPVEILQPGPARVEYRLISDGGYEAAGNIDVELPGANPAQAEEPGNGRPPVQN